MKIILTEGQYNALMDIDELKSRTKEKFNSGNFHMIYPMEGDPTKLIKVGAKSIIDSWYSLFVANPNLFPKVYKRGEVPLETNGRKFIGAYVIIERLNTNDFKRIWGAFESLLGKYHQVTGDKHRLGLQNLFVTIEDHMDIINKMLEIAKSNQVVHDFFKEFVDLLLQVYEIKPSADIHEDQFGLDADGKIKCLDL